MAPWGFLSLQATPAAPANISHDVIEALTKRTQDGGTEVVNAKAGKVSIQCGVAEDWAFSVGGVGARRTTASSLRQGREHSVCWAADKLSTFIDLRHPA